VKAGLDKVADLRRQEQFKDARFLLEQTRSRLGGSGLADLRQRLERESAILALVDRLDAIRLVALTRGDGNFDFASADRDYGRAFEEAGIATEGERPALVADRVRMQNSEIAEQLLAALDTWATVARDKGRRAWLLAVAREVDPNVQRGLLRDPDLWADRAALKRQVDKANVADLSPQLAAALGMMLYGREGYGLPLLTETWRLYPKDVWLALGLGETLQLAGKPDEAAGYFRVALALRPTMSSKWNSLGVALAARGLVDEAIKHYQKAIELEPEHAYAHYNLGNALMKKGMPEKAIEHYRRAIELDPGSAAAHTNLGNALRKKGLLDEAIRQHKKAITLDPQHALAHFNLGVALMDKDLVDEAIEHFEQAVTIDPRFAEAHVNHGLALWRKGQVEKEIAAYQKAIAINPKFANAHLALGMALFLRMGRFAEACEALRRGRDLLPEADPRRSGATQHLRLCEQMRDVERKLPGILKGDIRAASVSERYLLASLCKQYKHRYYIAARFYAELLEPEPATLIALAVGQAGGLPNLWQVGWTAEAMNTAGRFGLNDALSKLRYDAACCAALAAAGKGEDAAGLDERERARLRQQARDWLTADLTSRTPKAIGDSKAREQLQKTLQLWQTDAALAGIRDPQALAKLPEQEQDACCKLWAEVAAVQKKAAGQP
jgi:tetratricopeptide (TPR) repeat protein